MPLPPGTVINVDPNTGGPTGYIDPSDPTSMPLSGEQRVISFNDILNNAQLKQIVSNPNIHQQFTDLIDKVTGFVSQNPGTVAAIGLGLILLSASESSRKRK